MVKTNSIDNMDNMDIVDSLYRGVFRNNVHYGMCCYNPIFDKTILGRYLNNYDIRRDNMNYVDLIYDHYIKNEGKTTERAKEKFGDVPKAIFDPKTKKEHTNPSSTTNQSQEAKADNGKPKLTLVPDQIIYDIAEVREYGNRKYGDPNNWKTVEIERYRDAAFRHFLAYIREPDGKDEESGIEHLKHLACNIAFLCALEKNKED